MLPRDGECERPSEDPDCVESTYKVCPVYPNGVDSISECPNSAEMVQYGPSGSDTKVLGVDCYCAWDVWGGIETVCPDPTPDLEPLSPIRR